MQDGDGDNTTRDPTPTQLAVPSGPAAQRVQMPLDRYRMLHQIGKGGMGEVIVARDEQIGREVAIKRMLETAPSTAATNRFLREAQIQGALDHPAIPPVHELAHDEQGRPYFVMKRLVGTTLTKILGAVSAGNETMVERYPRERLLRALAEACLAVELAHTRGVVHRDLKPSNIMLGDFGEVFVLDWGVAKVIGDFDPWFGAMRDATPSIDATMAGAVVGTPGYIAPEQAQAREVDGRADVYSLGCILFEILAGTAHRGGSTRPSERSPERSIPPELDDLCVAAMAAEPEQRLTTARALGEGIQRYLDGDRDLAARRRLALEHFGRASAAAATRDHDEAHRLAIREAGRALALDPALEDAATLLGRLMLEPPAKVPREVEQMIEDDEVNTARTQAKVGSVVLSMHLIVFPIVVWSGLHEWAYLYALAALLAVQYANAWLTTRMTSTRGWSARWLIFISVVCAGALVALYARMTSPLLMAPSIAVGAAIFLLANPQLRRGWRFVFLVAALLVGVLVPWLLEIVGVLPPTMTFANGVVTLGSPDFHVQPIPAQISLAIFVVQLVIVTALVMRAFGKRNERVQQQLMFQTWQLGQLVPRA